MNSINTEDLGKSITHLLEALADILAAGGPPFLPALDELRSLLQSQKMLDADAVKRRAFILANLTDEISDRVGRGAVELKAYRHSEPSPAGGGGQPQPPPGEEETTGLILSVINQVASLRPKFYQKRVRNLAAMIKAGTTLNEILRRLIDLIIQIKMDFWEERSKTFKHIEKVLNSLEDAEKDFIVSLGGDHDFIKQSNQTFTLAMEEGLEDINALTDPGKYDLEELCRRLSQKVGKLREYVLEKKATDQVRLEVLETQRESARKKHLRNQRDYEEFNRQSHEMLQEIENLRAISLRDSLTDTYNRRAYDGQIAKTVAAFKDKTLKTCGLIIFDIDNFREFNNIYGHLAGDRVLSYVARLTKESLRRDDLIFRYGGDEFVILIPNANLETALAVAEKVRRHIASVEFKLFKNSEITVKVTVSMGVSEISEGDDEVSFFTRADRAMYSSKSTGRNRVSPSFQASGDSRK